MTHDDFKLRQAHIDWMEQYAGALTHAATLTLKPYRVVLTARGEIRDPITPLAASQDFGFFIQRLNASLFGHAAKRYGKSIAILPTLEGLQRGKLLHYHCAFGQFPTQHSDKAIEAKIREAWQKTRFGNEQVDVRRMATAGWLSYMGKEIRSNNADALDIANVRLPSASLV